MRLETAVPTLPSSRGRMRWMKGKVARTALTRRWTPEGMSVPEGTLVAADWAWGRPRPRERLFSGWAEAPARECEAEEDGVAVNAEPVGSGAPTARGVGAEGCGVHERMRVEVDPGDEDDARVGPGVGFAGAGGAESGVKGSRSLKRANSRLVNRSAG